MTNAIGIALTGLNSAAQRANVSASNIANAHTSGSINSADHKPYTPITAESKAIGENGGVETKIVNKPNSVIQTYAPDSPFADENGLIGVPNIDIATEIIHLKVAETTYKANIATIKAAENMEKELLKIFDEKA